MYVNLSTVIIEIILIFIIIKITTWPNQYINVNFMKFSKQLQEKSFIKNSLDLYAVIMWLRFCLVCLENWKKHILRLIWFILKDFEEKFEEKKFKATIDGYLTYVFFFFFFEFMKIFCMLLKSKWRRCKMNRYTLNWNVFFFNLFSYLFSS